MEQFLNSFRKLALMKFKVSSGLNIQATALGNPDDPLVILLHGGGQTRHAWRGTAGKLSQAGFYAVAIDLRGHGDSDWSEDGDYAIESYKEDLKNIINQLGKSASLIGASLGGMISLCTAGDRECSDLCNALVLSLIHI